MRGLLRKRRSLKAGPLALALAFQGVLLVGTAFVVVFVPSMKSEPEFTARKTIYLPQRELDHQMAVAELQQVAGPPKMLERLTTSALLPDSLPALPSLPKMEYNLLDSERSSHGVDSLFGVSSLAAAMQGLQATVSKASLFGVEDSGERLLLMFDDGGSVLNKARKSGVPISEIRREAVSLVKSLDSNTLFGFVRFVRRVGTFQDYLVPATAANREMVKEWIEGSLGTGRKKQTGLEVEGSGIEAALRVAFQLEPDVIFLLSDADYQRYREGSDKGEQVPWRNISRTLGRLQNEVPGRVRIHFIGFQVEEEHSREMRKIVRRYGGSYREL